MFPFLILILFSLKGATKGSVFGRGTLVHSGSFTCEKDKNFVKGFRVKEKKTKTGGRSYGRVESYREKNDTYDMGTGGKVFERVEKMESFYEQDK